MFLVHIYVFSTPNGAQVVEIIFLRLSCDLGANVRFSAPIGPQWVEIIFFRLSCDLGANLRIFFTQWASVGVETVSECRCVPVTT